jgi:MinD superfamily P-loop ATPase
MKKMKRSLLVRFERLSEASQRSISLPESYQDVVYICRDCACQCQFKAEQQQSWYELEKRYFYQRPVRCAQCHNMWCETRRIKLRVARASHPVDYATALVQLHQRTGKGNLAKALHLLRSHCVEPELQTYCVAQLRKAQNTPPGRTPD